MLTKRELEMQARCNAATKGPWYRDMIEDGEEGEGPLGVHPGGRGPMIETNDVVAAPPEGHDYPEEVASCTTAGNATFVAHVPKDVTYALGEIERLRNLLLQVARDSPEMSEGIMALITP